MFAPVFIMSEDVTRNLMRDFSLNGYYHIIEISDQTGAIPLSDIY